MSRIINCSSMKAKNISTHETRYNEKYIFAASNKKIYDINYECSIQCEQPITKFDYHLVSDIEEFRKSIFEWEYEVRSNLNFYLPYPVSFNYFIPSGLYITAQRKRYPTKDKPLIPENFDLMIKYLINEDIPESDFFPYIPDSKKPTRLDSGFIIRNDWRCSLLPYIPQPYLYDKYEQYKRAMLNWLLVANDTIIPPTHPSKLNCRIPIDQKELLKKETKCNIKCIQKEFACDYTLFLEVTSPKNETNMKILLTTLKTYKPYNEYPNINIEFIEDVIEYKEQPNLPKDYKFLNQSINQLVHDAQFIHNKKCSKEIINYILKYISADKKMQKDLDNICCLENFIQLIYLTNKFEKRNINLFKPAKIENTKSIIIKRAYIALYRLYLHQILVDFYPNPYLLEQTLKYGGVVDFIFTIDGKEIIENLLGEDPYVICDVLIYMISSNSEIISRFLLMLDIFYLLEKVEKINSSAFSSFSMRCIHNRNIIDKFFNLVTPKLNQKFINSCSQNLYEFIIQCMFVASNDLNGSEFLYRAMPIIYQSSINSNCHLDAIEELAEIIINRVNKCMKDIPVALQYFDSVFQLLAFPGEVRIHAMKAFKYFFDSRVFENSSRKSKYAEKMIPLIMIMIYHGTKGIDCFAWQYIGYLANACQNCEKVAQYQILWNYSQKLRTRSSGSLQEIKPIIDICSEMNFNFNIFLERIRELSKSVGRMPKI